MFVKTITPINILNSFATEFIAQFPIINNRWDSRRFEIEFYDKDKNPVCSRKGEITGLPVNANLTITSNSDFDSPEIKEMFDMQDKAIFEEIKNLFGLSYDDDSFEVNDEIHFSYTRLTNVVNPDEIGKWIPLQV